MNQDPNIPVVNPTTQPILPPEPQAPTEEPVMMVANIDEAPQAVETLEPAVASSPSQPVEPTTDLPVAGPDLGQPNQPETENETVPTFQQLGEVPIEGADPTPVVDDAPSTVPTTLPPVVNPVVETSTPETEPENVPTFQQLAEVPVEGAPNPLAMEEAQPSAEKEEEKKKPKKGKRIITILIVLVVLGLIGGGLSFALKGLNTLGKEDLIKTLKPVRSENSRTNIVIIGTESAKKEETANMLNAVYGGEESSNECSELEGRYLKYQAKKLALKSKKAYNAFIPCDVTSKQKYLIDGDGNNTVDGAVIIVSAEEGLLPETIQSIELLKNTGVKKVIVYVIGDKSTVETQIIEQLDANGFDSTYVPILNSTEVNEETIIQIMDKIDTNVKKVVDKKQNAAIQSFDKLSLMVYVKTPEEDGIADSIKKDMELSIKTETKTIPIKITLPEGMEEINPGSIALLNATLEEKIPLEETMRLKIYQNDSIVAIGVISELK